MKTNFINNILQNTRRPEGFWGRIILRAMNRGHAQLAEWGFSHVEWGKKWTVLDIGCGGGANLARMLDLCPQGIIHGMDVSEESVAFARRLNRKALDRRCFITPGRAEELLYDADTFDMVTAFETIYFWTDPEKAFAEVYRVLKPGGQFMICCEAGDPADTRWTRRIEGMVIHPVREIKNMLSQTGFSHINIYKGDKGQFCITAAEDEAATFRPQL